MTLIALNQTLNLIFYLDRYRCSLTLDVLEISGYSGDCADVHADISSRERDRSILHPSYYGP